HALYRFQEALVRLLIRGKQLGVAENRVLTRAALHAGELLDQQAAVLRGLDGVVYRALALGRDLVNRQRVVDQGEDERQERERNSRPDESPEGTGGKRL